MNAVSLDAATSLPGVPSQCPASREEACLIGQSHMSMAQRTTMTSGEQLDSPLGWAPLVKGDGM